jgi:hypothetical protein
MKITITDPQDAAILAIKTTNPAVLRDLSAHENAYVRLKVATNINTPGEVQDVLTGDADKFVSDAAKLSVTHAAKFPNSQAADEWNGFFITRGGKTVRVFNGDIDNLTVYEATAEEIERIKANHNPRLSAFWQEVLQTQLSEEVGVEGLIEN